MKYLKRHFTDDEIEELITNYPLTGKNGLRRMLSEIDMRYFAQAYFPKYFNKPFSNFHLQLMEAIDDLIKNEGQRLVIGCPRGNGKSTISSFLAPLHIILFEKVRFLLIVSATEDTGIPFLQMIKDELVSNDAIIEDFGYLKGEKWAANEIWLNNDTCLMVRGIDGSIRGIRYKSHRVELILGDDLLKDKVVESETAREKLANTYKEALLNSGDELTRVLIVGTVLHPDDLMSELLSPETTGYKQLFFQSIISWAERTDLWEQWRKLYISLEDKNREETAYNFYLENKDEMLKGAKCLWEEKYDYYYLMKKLVDDGESSFYKEQMCQPRGLDEYVFQNISYWDKLPDLNECNLVMFVDPAMGKKDGDHSAITILAKDKQTGYKYVVDGISQRIPPDQLLDLIVEKVKQYETLETLAFESTLFQEYLLEDLKKKLKKAGVFHVRVLPIKPRTNKEVRIMNLQPDIANGILKFNRDSITYNTKVKDWTAKKKREDDAIDSCQGAWQVIEKSKKPKKVYNKPVGW